MQAENTNWFVATPLGDFRFLLFGKGTTVAAATVLSEYTGKPSSGNCELSGTSVEIVKSFPYSKISAITDESKAKFCGTVNVGARP